MRRRQANVVSLTAAALFVAALVAPAHASPQRIVSLNLCIDQLLIDLVPRERIAGVSYLAADPTLSASPEKFAGLPLLKGASEEVLTLAPDLVLAGAYTTGATVDLLRRLGLKVAIVPIAGDFDGMRESIRQIARAVGESARGEAMIAEFNDRLSAARSTVPSRPTALAYQVSSLVSGPTSLLDAALDAAGYHNLARDLDLGLAGRLPLEMLVAAPPDLIVLANRPDDFQTVLADNLRHPALTRVLAKRPSIALPMPYWMCATPKIAEAVETLAALKATRFAAAAP